MAREISLSFELGARLAGSYQTAFQQAASQAHSVARAIREMERTPQLQVTMPNLVDDGIIDKAFL